MARNAVSRLVRASRRQNVLSRSPILSLQQPTVTLSPTVNPTTYHHRLFTGPSRPPRSLLFTAPLRNMSTTPSPTEMTAGTYHTIADKYIESLVEALEEIQERNATVDVEYSVCDLAGVVTLQFPPLGTYVINKQPPNKQIWLSSPVSGPKRYDWVETEGGTAAWIYLRDGSGLTALLKEELKDELAGVEG